MRFSMLFALSVVATTACSGPDPHQDTPPPSATLSRNPPPPAAHANADASAGGSAAAPLSDEELDRMLDALEQEIDKK